MNEIKIIGEINFHDIKVKVYFHKNYENDLDKADCVWRMRNPDSCYQGIIYRNNETGEVTYPDDAVIPEQTDKDREMLPNFIITGRQELDDDFVTLIIKRLETEYIRRNQIR